MKIRSARGAAHRRKRGARTHACRAETSLGACWPMLPSKHKRRDESRRGTHECVRHVSPHAAEVFDRGGKPAFGFCDPPTKARSKAGLPPGLAAVQSHLT